MLTLLLACTGADPRFAGYARALEAYDRGRAALDAGKPAEAVKAFADARVADPDSLPLRFWEAKALADAGDLASADARITEVIQSDPRNGPAWYERAAWRARAGRLDEAASDLREGIRLGARSPLEAAADPDFAAALGHPAFAGVLPAAPVEATLRGSESVFVGSTYTLEIVVDHLPGVPLTLERSGGDPGCLQVHRVLQDDHAEAGKVTSTLTIEANAVRGCRASIGPFTVRAQAATATLDGVPVVVEAPPDFAGSAPPPFPSVLPFPGSHAPTDSTPVATRVGPGVVALAGPERTLSAGGRAPDVALEWRVDAQTRAIGGWWWGDGPLTLSDGAWSTTVP